MICTLAKNTHTRTHTHIPMEILAKTTNPELDVFVTAERLNTVYDTQAEKLTYINI